MTLLTAIVSSIFAIIFMMFVLSGMCCLRNHRDWIADTAMIIALFLFFYFTSSAYHAICNL